MESKQRPKRKEYNLLKAQKPKKSNRKRKKSKTLILATQAHMTLKELQEMETSI